MNNSDLKKIILLSSATSGTSGLSKKDYSCYNDSVVSEIFYTIDPFFSPTIPDNLPIINYIHGRAWNKLIETVPEYKNLNSRRIINFPEYDIPSLSNKITLTKRLNSFNFVPVTVYNKDLAKNLEFPIVGKPKDGMKGLGIGYFKTKEEFIQSGKTYDLYQESIQNVKAEYRAFIFNGNISRIDIRKNENSITNKDEKNELKFKFIRKLHFTDNFLSQLKTIVDEVQSYTSFTWYALDIMEDKDGKLWLLELNSAPGMGVEKLVLLYKLSFNFFYGHHYSKYTKEQLDTYKRTYLKLYDNH